MDARILQQVEEFFSAYPRLHAEHGQALLVGYAQRKEVLWIESGQVRMFAIQPDGTEVTLHFFRSPAFFPLMLVLSRYECDYFFEAFGTVAARRAPAAQVVEFIRQHPEVLFDLTQRFADGIVGLLKHVEQLTTQAMPRVARLLEYLAEHFGVPEKGGMRISLPMSHEAMGKWCGLARETVSHQLERLAKEKVIRIARNRLIILDKERLKEFAHL